MTMSTQGKSGKRFGRTTVAAAVLGALLVSMTPAPAHAFLLLDMMTNIFGGIGRLAVASTTGQLAQTKAEENMTDTKALNQRQNVNAKTAAEIAKDHKTPKTYDACATTKGMQAQQAAGGDAEAMAKAGAISNNMTKATLKDVAKMLKNRCDAGLCEKSDAYTAMGQKNGESYGGSDMTIMSCFEKSGMPMPPAYSPSKDRWTKIPEGVEEKYKPWVSCYGACLSLATRLEPVSRGKTATADAVCAIAASRYQQIASAAQSACMRNLIKRSRAESGPMAKNQKEACEKGKASHSFGKDAQTGSEYSCDKGMSDLEQREARANCMSGDDCMLNKVAQMKQTDRNDFETNLATQRIEMEGEKWQAMNDILDGMAATAAAVPPNCSGEGSIRVSN